MYSSSRDGMEAEGPYLFLVADELSTTARAAVCPRPDDWLGVGMHDVRARVSAFARAYALAGYDREMICALAALYVRMGLGDASGRRRRPELLLRVFRWAGADYDALTN
jgi:hypothetical protein